MLQAEDVINRNYDIRNDMRAERAGKVGVSASQQAAAARLAAKAPGFDVSYDAVSGLPKMVSALAPGSRLTKSAAPNPVAAARDFLTANAALYRLSEAEVGEAGVVYVSKPARGETGATIVRLSQSVDRVPVFGAEMAVVMDVRNRVVATAGTLYPGLDAVQTKGSLRMSDALAIAAGDLAGRAFDAGDFVAGPVDQGGKTVFTYTPDRSAAENPTFGENLRVEQVVFPVASGEAIAGYYVEVHLLGEPSGSGPAYAFVVSATDGAVLFRNNLKADDAFRYRTFADTTANCRPFDGVDGTAASPHPTGLNDNYQSPFVTENEVMMESLLGATDPWLSASATQTTGNNVDVYMDITTPDGYNAGDVRGVTNGPVDNPSQFLYTFDVNAATTDATKRQAKAVHLFYYNNWLHDVWYQRGFNEVSRNAQTDNFGRGGSGNDSVRGEGEDRSGTNNANMFTPADGGRPIMQMYRFTGPPNAEPDRDSSTDFGIVAHEWMHYMSNRLINNANGLNNNQGRSMGEGWGDWNGLINAVRDGDNLDGVFVTGGWTTYYMWSNYTNNYYFGIRRYPYSTDQNKAPLHFRDIGPGQVFPANVPRNTNVGTTASEFHNAGEIWCQMLWECSVNLMKAYGVEEGRTRMMQYVADGMKNTPSSPTYGQARDGVINAANAAHPEDVPLLWQGFSKRGIGEGAVSPASGSTNHSGITESFVAPVAMPDDTFGVFLGANFFERNVFNGGAADASINYGVDGWTPLVGNWDGGTTVGEQSADTPGLYDPTTGFFFLRNANAPGAADLVFQFGPGGQGWLPIAGDWDGDGVTTVGLYAPATGFFFLRNSNAPGAADLVFQFGPGGQGWLPIAGDWDGDGDDTIGAYDPATSTFFLKNTNASGAGDVVVQFGVGGQGYQPLAGDWDSNGADSVAVRNPAAGAFYFKYSNTPGPADRVVSFGPAGPAKIYAGNLDGQ